MFLDKRILNFLVIIILSLITLSWTFFIFHQPIRWDVVVGVITLRILASLLIYKDYSLSWSKASPKTFLIKVLVVLIPLMIYIPIFHGEVRIAFMISEAMTYLVSISFLMYFYYFLANRASVNKTKNVVIYGAGKAGMRIEEELRNSEYKVCYFCDDDKLLQGRSIDGIKILSSDVLLKKLGSKKQDLLVIAIPSAPQKRIKEIYEKFNDYFTDIKILPPLNEILKDQPLQKQLKDISLEDLLARHPKDLDKKIIKEFIKGKKILITGAGGSIGSEIARQCKKYGAKKLILVDNSEYNLYKITEEFNLLDKDTKSVVPVLQSVTEKEMIDENIKRYKPDIVIHAAAYKHVPLVEHNPKEAIINNIIGTKNVIDSSIKYGVKKFVLISTDKAVRPTNIMGATKRVCELYAQNIDSKKTEIVAVRFGNVLGSSGSVIPKFKEQIKKGGPITVTHPDVTRYFMLIPEACQLVLQAAAIAKGGEIFILDMGEPVKIVDLAKKMLKLYGKEDEIEIVFTGLRPGEKLYEELLLDESEQKTKYESIYVTKPTFYDINRLNRDIEELLNTQDIPKKLKEIVKEYQYKHKNN